MNKYQESLAILKKIEEERNKKVIGISNSPVADVLQELVDKATPKKRVFVKETPSVLAHDECPVCRAKVSPIRLYCDNCGQRLE